MIEACTSMYNEERCTQPHFDKTTLKLKVTKDFAFNKQHNSK